MNYVAKSSPSMRSMDQKGRVIYVGSLSKTVSPGIRLGFIVAHRDIIREARIARGVMMRHPPTIVQEIVALFFQLGHYDSHLRNIERRYNKRWHAMNRAITRHLGMLQRTDSEGGTSFWLTGPGWVRCIRARRASTRKGRPGGPLDRIITSATMTPGVSGWVLPMYRSQSWKPVSRSSRMK